MTHAVFQTAQIMPINTHLVPTTKTLSSAPSNPLLPASSYRVLPLCRKGLVVRNSSAIVDGEAMAGLERCFRISPSECPPSSSSASAPSHGPVMKGGQYGAFGAVTLEKSKLDTTQKQTKSSPELFDRKFLEAVLNEWQKTMMDLPSGLRQAYEMGLVSSAQLVKYIAINGRPTTARFISRTLPQALSRGFIGRVYVNIDAPLCIKVENQKLLVTDDEVIDHGAILVDLKRSELFSDLVSQILTKLDFFQTIPDPSLCNSISCGVDTSLRMIADPAFLYRFLLEQAATIGSSVLWEVKNRKERIKKEWDLALVNVLTVTACNAIVVWSLAPCRSYGNTFRFDLQNTLQKLPNNVFEKSYPLREFDMQKRIHSFFYKAAELSVTIPSVSNNALGYGAFLGIYANLRYQLLSGFDRAMVTQFDVIGVGLFFSTALRIMNAQLGETSRLAWLGVEVDPLAHSDELLKQAYNRPSETDTNTSSKWFISKNAVTSGLGLLGFKQDQSRTTSEGGAPPPKARRKRIVRKKVTT
ncbi:Protein of unknown function DUF3411 [Cynara cardunculus var. scolymus]|uniref:Uncharacterized protein n=1 Tax=Cynara cardunculus var. scolymus TaxID=59895 RepID=A0A103Y3D5_CYNCS|nr:Protein of unknown function DUF3411 [Cynara cardunculus var. scolymus]